MSVPLPDSPETAFAAIAVGAALVIALAGAVLAQHLKYLRVRRERAEDRQPLLYGSAFHVVTFLRAPPGGDLLSLLRALRAAIGPTAHWIYAGKALFTAPSAQIGPCSWSAVMLVQYPSRGAYDADAKSPRYLAALAGFAESYAHGLRRPLIANLLLPQALLLAKVRARLSRAPSPYPFIPRQAQTQGEGLADLGARLRDHGGYGACAAVVFNISRRGTAAQTAADRRYTRPMLQLMAERGYGPLHVGWPVALRPDEAFEQVAIVYYPSADYFADLVSSTFYQQIFPSKQLGDNQSVITVPLNQALDAGAPRAPAAQPGGPVALRVHGPP